MRCLVLSLNLLLQVDRAVKIRQALEDGRNGERSAGGRPSAWLHRLPGTTAWRVKLKEDLGAYRQWLGAPAFFYTQTLSTATLDLQGSWVLSTARQRGETVDIFSARDERSKLTLRPGQPLQPSVETAYYVHSTRTHSGTSGNCPYHPGCTREKLGDYYARSVRLSAFALMVCDTKLVHSGIQTPMQSRGFSTTSPGLLTGELASS